MSAFLCYSLDAGSSAQQRHDVSNPTLGQVHQTSRKVQDHNLYEREGDSEQYEKELYNQKEYDETE